MRRDASTKRSNPRDSLSDERSHISKNLSHSHRGTPLQTNQTTNQTDTETHERHDNEHENQGIRGNGTGKRAYPLDSLGNEGGNIGKNSCNSDRSILKTYHLSIKKSQS
nr:MAG: hypothetical protein [Inoviridae sp.]